MLKLLNLEVVIIANTDGFLVKRGRFYFRRTEAELTQSSTQNRTRYLTATCHDLDSVLIFFEKYGKERAAVIVELIAGSMNLVPGKPVFLANFERYAINMAAFWIFDKMISGFQVVKGRVRSLNNKIWRGMACCVVALGKLSVLDTSLGAYGWRIRMIMRLHYIFS